MQKYFSQKSILVTEDAFENPPYNGLTSRIEIKSYKLIYYL